MTDLSASERALLPEAEAQGIEQLEADAIAAAAVVESRLRAVLASVGPSVVGMVVINEYARAVAAEAIALQALERSHA